MKDDHVHPLFAGLMKAISGMAEIPISDEAYEKHKAQKRRVKAINPKRHINR